MGKPRHFFWIIYGALLQAARTGVSLRTFNAARNISSKAFSAAKIAGHIEPGRLDPLYGRMYTLTELGEAELNRMESHSLDEHIDGVINENNKRKFTRNLRQNYMKSKQAERMKQLLTMAVDGVSFKTYRNAGINIMTAHKYLKLAIASEYIALQMVRAHNERFYAITEKGQQALAAMP